MKTTLVDRIKKDLRSAEILQAKQDKQFESLRTKLCATDLLVQKLREALKAISGPESLLGLTEGAAGYASRYGSESWAAADRHLPREEEPPSPPTVYPKKPSVVCRSCGEPDKLFETTRSLSTGKVVSLVICSSCSSEQLK